MSYLSIKRKVEANLLGNLIPNLLASFAPHPGIVPTSASDIAVLFEELKRTLGGGVITGALPSTFVGSVGGAEEEQAVNGYYSSLLEMLRYPIVLKLKTVPMISISSPRVLFKRVVVLINTNDGMTHSRDTGWNRIMTGVYYILGFKHVFSAKEAYSQFLLIREPFDFASYIFGEYGDDTPEGNEFSLTSKDGKVIKY